MNGLIFLPTVVFKPTKAGLRILGALDQNARRLRLDVIITCGAEGHPPDDPHTLGEAFDVRTNLLGNEEKRLLLKELMTDLASDDPGDVPTPASDGIGTFYFWGWIEDFGLPNEHLHVQRRKGRAYV